MDNEKMINAGLEIKGLTARQLTDHMGVKRTMYYQWIRPGLDLRFSTIKAIADGLGMRVSELVALGE
jgi:transcriptional regulator with XRE-family HTH domain